LLSEPGEILLPFSGLQQTFSDRRLPGVPVSAYFFGKCVSEIVVKPDSSPEMAESQKRADTLNGKEPEGCRFQVAERKLGERRLKSEEGSGGFRCECENAFAGSSEAEKILGGARLEGRSQQKGVFPGLGPFQSVLGSHGERIRGAQSPGE
jgi:hypothetical protein